MDKTPVDSNDPLERLDRAEANLVLRIGQEAGAKRYFRTFKRLKDVLATPPGRSEGW
jgi:hypothetical protein